MAVCAVVRFAMLACVAGWPLLASPSGPQTESGTHYAGRYLPGTPSWVPLIDACMERGGRRPECIESLPAQELEMLEAWEQRNSAWRRRRLNQNSIGAASQKAAGPEIVRSGDGFDWNAIVSLPREQAIALAIALAYSAEYERYRPGILNLVFRLWAQEDPAAAHERLLSLAGDFDITRIQIEVIRHWLLSDARAAIAAAADAGEPTVFEMALRDYSHQDPEAALAVATEYGSRLGKAEWTGVIANIAGRNPQLASQHVASLGVEGEYLVSAVISNLSIEDPEAALDWILTHFPQSTEHFDSIASFFFIQDPAEAFAYLERIPGDAPRTQFGKALCQAKAVNEASRAKTELKQPPPGYADGVCEHYIR